MKMSPGRSRAGLTGNTRGAWGFALLLAANAFPVPVHGAAPADPAARAGQLPPGFSRVVKQVAPKVVYVYSSKTVRRPGGAQDNPFLDDPLFRKFFRDQFEESPNAPKPRTYRERGLGSGVISSSRFLVVKQSPSK